MKVTILCENQVSDLEWLAEWGFSAFIQYEDQKILFDTGFSDVYWKNSIKAGIDLEQVDFIALSHFHLDHTRGLLFHQFQKKINVIAHPRVLNNRLDAGDEQTNAEYKKIQNLIVDDLEPILNENVLEFFPGAFFLGEIPRVTEFESGEYEGDAMPDDTALAFRTDKGAVVISGCSHAGICNICEYAKKVTGQKLYAVLGGFHLLHEDNPPVKQTIQYFKREQPTVLAPMHCVDFEYMAQFYNQFGVQKLSAGDVLELFP